MQRVTSRQNPRLRDAARLIASARERRKTQRCVLEGEHLIGVYQDRHGAPETIVVSDAAIERDAIAAIAKRDPARTLIVPSALFAELAALPAHVGVLAVVPTPTPTSVPSTDAGITILPPEV